MNNVNISIIIPCYNSARFISATLDMLVSQGLGGCEVIVVNDGSTDGTAQIVRGYAERYPEITLIDKQNEGVSVARNTGMDAAKGKYIYFLDSDDTLEEGTLDFFRNTLAENPGKEFFAFGYYTRVNGKLRKDYSARRYEGMVLDAALLKQSFFSKKLCFNICSCIYESRFLRSHGICFTPGLRIGEDIEFLLKVIRFAHDCVYSARHCFVYQIRNDSVMQGYKSYSILWANVITVVHKILSNDYPCNEYDKNFFMANYYMSALVSYLRSDVAESTINEVFIMYEFLLSKKIVICSFRRIGIATFRIIKPHILLSYMKGWRDK